MFSCKLPTEILEEIFRFVKAKNEDQLIQCVFVCKSWYEPAIRLYYETLVLSGDPRKLLFRLSNQPPGINVGIWAKELLAVCDPEHLSQQGYLQLLSYLPNLNTLNVKQSSSRSFHLSWLLNRNDNSCVKNLNSIIAGAKGMNQYEYRVYFACAYSFRFSLNFLELSYLGSAIKNMGGLSGTHLSFLKDFKELQELSVTNLSEKRGDINFDMFSVLQLCPKLIRLSIVSDYLEPIQNQLTKKDISTFNGKLKDISLSIPTLTNTHIKNIISNFSNQNLSKFNLVMTHTIPNEWFDRNQNIIQEFGEYLGKIKKVSFNILRFMPTEYPPLSMLTPETLCQYWPFIFAIMGKNSQSLNCHLSVRIDDKINIKCSNFDNILIKRNQKSMYITYILDAAKFSKGILAQTEIPSSIDPLVPLPSKSSMMLNTPVLSKQQIISLEIAVGGLDRDIPVMPITKCIKLLHSILKKYKRLNLIMFSCYTMNYEMYYLKFGSCIEDCDLKTKQARQFFKMDNKRYKTVTTPTIENLTHVLLKGATLEQFDFYYISKILVNINYLKIINCFMALDRDKIGTTIDLKNMKNLKQLVLDIQFLKDVKCSQINIQVEYLKKNILKSYKWKRPFIRGKKSEFVEIDSYFSQKQKWSDNSKNNKNTRLLFIKCYQIDAINICLENHNIAATFQYP